MGCCICVEEAQIAIIENMGKFSRVVHPGCSPLNCWCERSVGILSLQIEQRHLDIETRTKDNVFVTVKLAMRVKVAASEAEFPKHRPLQKKDKKKKKKVVTVAVDGTANRSSKVVNDSDKAALIESSSESEEESVTSEEEDVPVLKKDIKEKELLYLAFYKLKDPISQISAYIDNYFRFHAMKYTLDDMYSAKDSMTNDLINKLNRKVNPFGYIVFDVFIVDIEPNQKVKNAMNEVVASEKERLATTTRARAVRDAKILAAEGEARTRELEGEGIANARRAIIHGLRQSVDEFQQAIPGADAGTLLTTVLMTQYMDTIKEAGSKGRNTFILPSSPAQVACIEEQMRQALASSERISQNKTMLDDDE